MKKKKYVRITFFANTEHECDNSDIIIEEEHEIENLFDYLKEKELL